VCTCNDPWIGPACAVPNGTCPNNCSGIGTCNKITGKCNCPSSNFNLDCSKRECLYNCSNHGICDEETGNCICDAGWGGTGCERIYVPCKNISCLGRGICNFTIGKCQCQFGYTGEDCSLRTCPRNCSYPNGTCNTTTGICECNFPYIGIVNGSKSDCSLLDCGGECIHEGVCDPTAGICRCGEKWTGEFCSLVRCPQDCSGNGNCLGGICNCATRWKGEGCQTQEEDFVLIALLAVILALVGLGLIVGAFFIWRHLQIQRLQKKLDEQENEKEDQNLDEFSSSSDDG